jgi:NDP-sugar pyrophosphorylase family protein
MTSPPRHALVLTAGLGTRLHPLTEVRAKPAVPIGGEPIVRRIARWLAGNGVTDLVLNLHHLPSSLTAIMGEGRDLGVRVRYSWEQPVVLGTAGGPRQALPLIDADAFLIVNGDTMTDVDLGALHATHVSSKALVTLAEEYSGRDVRTA